MCIIIAVYKMFIVFYYVIEKNETIDALTIENKMLRQGKGDGTYPERTYEEKIVSFNTLISYIMPIHQE